MTSADAPRLDGQEKSSYWVAGFVVLLATLCGLFYYKWGGALRTIGGVQTAGHWTGSAQGLTTGGVLTASLFYFRRIWLALVYGLLIGAAVRAFVSPRRVVALLGAGGAVRRPLVGGVAGAPLMRARVASRRSLRRCTSAVPDWDPRSRSCSHHRA
jgi:uncharacterized membrane protein YraQ (UPF0718 family)